MTATFNRRSLPGLSNAGRRWESRRRPLVRRGSVRITGSRDPREAKRNSSGELLVKVLIRLPDGVPTILLGLRNRRARKGAVQFRVAHNRCYRTG